MTILLKVHRGARSHAGAAFLSGFSGGMTRQGHRVILAARHLETLSIPSEISACYRLGLGKWSSWLDFPLVALQIWRICRRHRVQVVHAHLGSLDFITLWLVRFFLQAPIVGHCHVPAPTAGLKKVMSGLLFRVVDACVVPSLEMEREYLRAYPVLSEKIRVVPNAAEKPRPYILSAARVATPKGIDILLIAFKDLVDAGHEVDLALCGRDCLRGELQDLSRRLGLEERVHFLGELERPQVLRLLQGCLFFVLASRWEGQSLAMLEALAAGKPVVVTRVGGVDQAVRDGEQGFVVPPQDPKALASAMKKLLEDGALRTRLGRNARRRSEQFSWSSHARRCARVYEDVLRADAARERGRGVEMEAVHS